MTIEMANRLVELRRAKGLSQEELAEKLGISRQAVSKWERAESSPDIDNIIMLSRLYGVSIDELVCNENEASVDGSELLLEREEDTNEEPVGSADGITEFFCSARADLEISGTDSEVCSVDIEGPEDEKETCRIFTEGNRLFVIQDADENRFRLFARRSSLIIKARLPRRMDEVCAELGEGGFMLGGISAGRVSAKLGGGRISIEETLADKLELKTGGGSMILRNVRAGSSELRTGGGSVKAEDITVSDRLFAKTGGGSIVIAGRITEIEAVSGGGDVRLSLNGSERVEAKTGGGGVIIELAGVGGAKAELLTGGGKASLTYKGAKIAGGHRVEGEVGDGSAIVNAKSGGGSVKLSVN